MLTPDHKAALPLHYSAYLAEVGCKKSASANVESVFSGAGNFIEQGGTAGSTLLERMVKLHYNWKYEFVRPTLEEVVDRYHEKFKANPMFVAEGPRQPLLPHPIMMLRSLRMMS